MSEKDVAARIMQEKAALACALASRYEIERGRNNPAAMKAAYAGAGETLAGAVKAARCSQHKPSNWWAFEREPWKRVNAESQAAEKAGADRERADRALRSAFAFAGAALALVNAPTLVPPGAKPVHLTGQPMMTRAQVESLPVGTKVRALAGGGGGVFTDDGDEETRRFDPGDVLTIVALDVYGNHQGLAVTVAAENGVVNVFDAGDYDGLYPFAALT
jgi:hypothetical protein